MVDPVRFRSVSGAYHRSASRPVAGTPERGAVVQRARELVEFARSQGYRLDELVEMIEDVA
jgi:GntR family transcriptional regulator